MNNAKSNLTTSKTLTAAMLVLGMSFGTAAALAPATADAASAAKKETRFKLEVSKVGKAVVGKKTSVTVTLSADNPWHMNKDFPTSLKLKASAGAKVAKATMKKKDAKTFTEHKMQFVVDITPTKTGKQSVDGVLKFAICKADSCSPAKAKVSIPLTVAKK